MTAMDFCEFRERTLNSIRDYLPEEFRVPKGFDPAKAELLLGSEKEAAAQAAADGTILLKPYEARVYLFHD